MTEEKDSLGVPEPCQDNALAPLTGNEPDAAKAEDETSLAIGGAGSGSADEGTDEGRDNVSVPECSLPDAMCSDVEEVPSEVAFEAEEEPAPDNALVQRRYIGVRMRKAGQVFFFCDDNLNVRPGSKLVVEFEQGSIFGEVDSIFYGDIPPDMEGSVQTQGTVAGHATAKDIALHAENSILAAEASAFCKTCIRQRSLDMKLVHVEVLHDRSKIIFYFTAPSRIDFRELVKDLVRNYRTRIELRQIGVRHETQMNGGLGNCGMVCCCHKYLRKFAPVTIKMAKEQNLFLNPAKLSGLCGRLLCCLSFEQSNYEEFNRRCPKLSKKYSTTSGTFKVLRANMFNRSITVSADTGEEKELSLDEWEVLEPRRAEPQLQEPRAQQQKTHADSGRKGRSRQPEERERRGDAGSGACAGDEDWDVLLHEDNHDGLETGKTGHALRNEQPGRSRKRRGERPRPREDARTEMRSTDSELPPASGHDDQGS